MGVSRIARYLCGTLLSSSAATVVTNWNETRDGRMKMTTDNQLFHFYRATQLGADASAVLGVVSAL